MAAIVTAAANIAYRTVFAPSFGKNIFGRDTVLQPESSSYFITVSVLLIRPAMLHRSRKAALS